jgi:60 kDa SS-A/Ro ribonucleoprotein
MANKKIFKSPARSSTRNLKDGWGVEPTTVVNNAGGGAYDLRAPHRLAQIAATGTMYPTFYVNGETQAKDILDAASKCDPLFVAQTAVYAREKGYMKDMPALLVAHLSTRDCGPVFSLAFRRVIDNGKMLRTFVQIMRSGVVGRKSLGTRPKKLVQEWLERAFDRRLIDASVGQDPSLADVIKMMHPKPLNAARKALYAYLIGKPHHYDLLPEAIHEFEAFKLNPRARVPNVPFQMLTAQPLTAEHWAAIGRNGGWHMVRMNLNTFARHGAFTQPGFTEFVVNKLVDPAEIARAKVFPYQLLTAYHMVDAQVPYAVKDALQDAMELAVQNVPAIDGRVVICPDVSGSMSSAVTGYRKGATSVVRCIDVAALMASALLRVNRNALVLPFEGSVVSTRRLSLNPRDTIMTNARKLSSVGGGSTNCAAPLAHLLSTGQKADVVIFVSDNESWVNSNSYGWGGHYGRGTEVLETWNRLKVSNPKAKLVCIDLTPNTTTQAPERDDILNVGGFSDNVWSIVGDFVAGRLNSDHWVGEIIKIDL